MFEFSVSKNMEKKQGISAYLLTLIVKELKIGVKQGWVVATSNIIKH